MRRAKTIAVLIITALLLPLFAACAGGSSEPGIVYVSPSAEVTALPASVPSDTPTDAPTATPRSYHMEQAVTCLDIPAESVRSYISVGDGVVFACYNDYSAENPMCYVQLIDVLSGEVLRSNAFAGGTGAVSTVFEDGSFLLTCVDDNRYIVLDGELNEARRIDVPDGVGVFSADLEKYYYLYENVLFVYSVSGGTSYPMQLSVSLNFCGINYISALDKLCLCACESEYNMQSCLCVIDAESGELELLLDGPDSFCRMDGGYGMKWYDAERGCCDVIYGNLLDAGQCRYIMTDFQDERYNPFTEYVLLEDSPYMLAVTSPEYDEDEGAAIGKDGTELYLLSDELSYCNLETYGLSAALFQPEYLPEANMIIADDYRDGAAYPMVIDCGKLAFSTVSEANTTSYEPISSVILSDLEQSRSGAPVAAALNGVRAYADAIEERYGITILISNQCEPLFSDFDHETSLTCDGNFSDEADSIQTALDSLDNMLSMYPDGFTKQFQNSVGEGGLRFMLSGPITSTYGVIAYANALGKWYNIVFDISMYSIESALHHELWHATESKLESVLGYELFCDGAWDALNPSGFYYNQSYEDWNNDYNDYVYMFNLEPSDGLYFVDSYSLTFAKEDRACIMEYIMSSGYEYDAEQLMRCPAIRAKLRFMADAMRKGFDTSGWDSPRWERFLGDQG